MSFESQKGNIGTLKVAEELIRQGYGVAFVFNQESPVDLIVLDENNVYRMQVKSVTEQNGSIKIGARRKSRKYKKCDFEFFGVYCLNRDECFFFRNEGERRSYSLRVKDGYRNSKKVDFYRELRP